jgi:hypothetical protein
MADKPQYIDVRTAGSRGGKARAQNLTPEQRAAIAKKAAVTRWAKEKKAKKAKAGK